MLAIAVPSVRAEGLARPETLLILPFENSTGQAGLNPLQSGIPDLLTAFLAPHSDAIQVVEREKLDAIMAEEGLKWENVTEAKGFGRLGRLTQARYVVRGSVTSLNHGLKIQAFLYETESTRLVKSFDRTGESGALNKMLDEISSELASVIVHHPLSPAAGGWVELPGDPNPEENLHMMYGLGYYYHGQFAKAIPEFMKILAKESGHADARYWLGKSFWGAGMKEDAVVEFKQFLKDHAKDSRAGEVQRLLGQPLKEAAP